MTMYYVKAKQIIDGTKQPAKKNAALAVEDGVVKGIIDAAAIPADADVLDYQDKTLMPGMINAHVHVLMPVGLDSGEDKKLTTMEKAAYGMKHLRDYLDSGVTTVRSLGTEHFYDLELKAAVEKGLIPGPHMLCAGKVICMSGGHGWEDGLQSDGVDECRKHSRELLREGVDLIKIMATGGVMTKGVEPGSPQLTWEEMAVCVEEAHKAGRKTATHAQGNQGIRNALKAGIDSIEHGIYLDDEIIEMMKKQGSYLVPTLAAPRCIMDGSLEHELPDYVLRKTKMIIDVHQESFRKAYKAGVKIAFGTDAGTPYNYHDKSVYELELMVDNGVSNADAIYFATHNSAECLGVLEERGTLETGKFADFILVDGDPLNDIKALYHIAHVFKDGVQVK